MEAFRLLRQQYIESLATAKQEGFSDAAIDLWEHVATHIIALVGEAGFDSLYARSVFLARSTFPWLTESPQSGRERDRFADLRANLKDKPPELASDANRLLLVIFTDTLASLIGEPLTERVLTTAWGDFVCYETGKGERDG